jgi:hypothetical protein
MNAVASQSSRAGQSGLRRRSVIVGAATTAITIAGVLYAVLKSSSADSSQLSSLPFVAGAAVVVAIVVFAWLVPARMAANGTGLLFAIVSLPFIAAFWSGISIIIAAGAVLVGLAYRASAGPKQGRALAAIVIGGLVAVLTLGAIVIG